MKNLNFRYKNKLEGAWPLKYQPQTAPRKALWVVVSCGLSPTGAEPQGRCTHAPSNQPIRDAPGRDVAGFSQARILSCLRGASQHRSEHLR